MTQDSAIIKRTRAMVADSTEALKEAEIALEILEAMGETPLREKTELERAKDRIKKLSNALDRYPRT